MSSAENNRGKKLPFISSTPVSKNIANNNANAKPYNVNSQAQNGYEQDEIDPDDPCLKKDEKEIPEPTIYKATVGDDPRFQQQNQTLRCFVSYMDFFRCEKLLGEEHEACEWFKETYNTFCPLKWIEDFDEARKEGRFPWHRKNQGKFPGNKYG